MDVPAVLNDLDVPCKQWLPFPLGDDLNFIDLVSIFKKYAKVLVPVISQRPISYWGHKSTGIEGFGKGNDIVIKGNQDWICQSQSIALTTHPC